MTYKTLHGTHSASSWAFATGKQVSFDLIDIFNIADGKITALGSSKHAWLAAAACVNTSAQ
jgi:hypothetical protein